MRESGSFPGRFVGIPTLPLNSWAGRHRAVVVLGLAFLSRLDSSARLSLGPVPSSAVETEGALIHSTSRSDAPPAGQRWQPPAR